MKRLCLFLAAGLAGALWSRAAEPAPVYELRIYTVFPGRMPALLARFRDHTRAIFDRHGMASVGYWLPVERREPEKLYYILRHPSRAAAAAAWRAFGADPEWRRVEQASEADGRIVSKVESTFLDLTGWSPTPGPSGGSGRIFELRTYTTNPGRLAALDTRFRDHTVSLFHRHGLEPVFFAHPLDADRGAGHTLVYLLAFPSRPAAEKSWDAFRADPEWVRVRTESERNGALLIPNGVKSVFLNPTDFSAIR